MIGLAFGSVVVNSIADTSGLAMIVLQKSSTTGKQSGRGSELKAAPRISKDLP
jgi:hypothetical protein